MSSRKPQSRPQSKEQRQFLTRESRKSKDGPIDPDLASGGNAKGSQITDTRNELHTKRKFRVHAPASANSIDSVKSWRTIRPRLAPIAERTASSDCRAVPLARSKIETFAQPMTNKKHDRAKHQIQRSAHAPERIRIHIFQTYLEMFGILFRIFRGETFDEWLQFRICCFTAVARLQPQIDEGLRGRVLRQSASGHRCRDRPSGSAGRRHQRFDNSVIEFQRATENVGAER